MGEPAAGRGLRTLRRDVEGRARTWVLIPVETKAREYHAKLLLACTAAEAGFNVILGSMNHLTYNIRFLPRGILFINNVTSMNERPVRRYRRMGHRVVAWCEEGIAYRNRASYRHERVAPAVMRGVQRFFAWGPYHAEDVRAVCAPEDRAKVVESGSPRLDLLRPGIRELFREESERIRGRLGRVLLVNTNFHRYNHFLGKGAYMRQLAERGKLADGDTKAFFQRWIDYLGEMYRRFAEMLPALSAAFPDHSIVVRPHPSEDHAAWRTEVSRLPNVHVIHEGSALPWILASEALIHNSCATGIEAAVLGIPVISYRPIRSETYDSYLPNAVSREASSLAQLTDLLRGLAAGGDRASPDTEPALRLFSGLEGPSACEGIVAELQRIDAPPQPFARGPLQVLALHTAIRLWPPVRGLVRRLVKGRNPIATYLDQKFPGLEGAELAADIARLRRVSGRFAGVRVLQVGDRLFALSAVAADRGAGPAPS